MHDGMPSSDGGGSALDRFAVADVANFVLRVKLVGERTKPLLAARDEDAAPAATG
jgi:hypothetical protein